MNCTISMLDNYTTRRITEFVEGDLHLVEGVIHIRGDPRRTDLSENQSEGLSESLSESISENLLENQSEGLFLSEEEEEALLDYLWENQSEEEEEEEDLSEKPHKDSSLFPAGRTQERTWRACIIVTRE